MMITSSSPRGTSLFSGWQILMLTSKECINCILLSCWSVSAMLLLNDSKCFQIQTLYFFLLKYKSHYWGCNKQNCQNSQQGRPWSDCFFGFKCVFSIRLEHSLDPDQLACKEASWSGSTMHSKKNKSEFNRTRVNLKFLYASILRI